MKGGSRMDGLGTVLGKCGWMSMTAMEEGHLEKLVLGKDWRVI